MKKIKKHFNLKNSKIENIKIIKKENKKQRNN